MEFINPIERRERAKEDNIIKKILHEKGIVTIDERQAKKKAKK